MGPALQQQADDLQEILVPAHRDAVFGDAAEPRHGTIIQALVELLHVADGAEGNGPAAEVSPRDIPRRRVYLVPLELPPPMPVIQQVMGKRESRWPEARDQDLL